MKWHDLFYIENNVLYNKVDRGGGAIAGRKSGGVYGNGYIYVSIGNKAYLAHRIIYEMRHGEIPQGMQVDHIDHNRTNNADSNHRLVSHKQNGRNIKKKITNSSGFTGVCWDNRRCKWLAYIMISGKHKHLGYFNNIEDAVCARKEAEIKFGFHNNHGK